MKVTLLANSTRSIDETVTAPHAQIIRELHAGLEERGHEAVIAAVGGKKTPATSIVNSDWNELVSTLLELGRDASRAAQQELAKVIGALALCRETAHCIHAAQQANAHSDVLHLHWGGHLYANMVSEIPVVHTVHHGYDDPGFWLTIKERVFGEMRGLEGLHWVVLGSAQTKFLPATLPKDHIHVVPHGVDYSGFPTEPSPKAGYVAFLGRIMRLKAPHLAIDAARAAGVPIKLAGGFDPKKEGEPDYFAQEIEPRLGPDVEYLGEIGIEAKTELLRAATALINPFQLEEPFGLVMVEALACGTPIIVPRRGSALDIVREGWNGCFAETVESIAEAIGQCARLTTHQAMQDDVRERFSRSKMIDGYVSVYDKAIAMGRTQRR